MALPVVLVPWLWGVGGAVVAGSVGYAAGKTSNTAGAVGNTANTFNLVLWIVILYLAYQFYKGMK